MRKRWARALALLVLSVGVAVLLGQTADVEDWASSPEAYFLTAEERADWAKLSSRDDRAGFRERYWLKRDPSPGTGQNEFKELVLQRIKTADTRFGITGTAGSRTARGLAFIVLGTPARIYSENTPHPPAPAPPSAGARMTPVASYEGNETTLVWSYDRERTPRLLETIDRPSLEIKIVIEPSRQTDAIQNPGLFNDIKETIARKSIVNPDLVTPAEARAAAGATAAEGLPSLPRRSALAADVRQALEQAPAVARRGEAFVGSTVIFQDHGDARTLVWVFTPPPSGRPYLHALVRGEDGREVLTVSEPALVSSVFSTRAPGLVALKELPLPPGLYSASVALTEEGGKLLASSVLPLNVPALEKGFAVSSMLITRGPAQGGSDPFFTFAGTALPPRADAAFANSESLWYFVELANPADPSKVFLEPRLRRGADPVAALPAFAVKLQPLGVGRYIVGIELPLATLPKGDYVLYLTVKDGEAEDSPRVLRRADFQLR
jgi:GWxTD domain-containing protein